MVFCHTSRSTFPIDIISSTSRAFRRFCIPETDLSLQNRGWEIKEDENRQLEKFYVEPGGAYGSLGIDSAGDHQVQATQSKRYSNCHHFNLVSLSSSSLPHLPTFAITLTRWSPSPKQEPNSHNTTTSPERQSSQSPTTVPNFDSRTSHPA